MTTEAGQTKALRVVDVLNRGMEIATMDDHHAATLMIDVLTEQVLETIASGARGAADLATAVVNARKLLERRVGDAEQRALIAAPTGE